MITAIEARGEDGGDFAPKAPPSGLGTHVELIDELVRTQVNKPSTHKASHVLYDFNPSIHPADHDHLKVRKQFGQLLTFLAESPLYFTTRDQTVHDQNGRITYRMLIGW